MHNTKEYSLGWIHIFRNESHTGANRLVDESPKIESKNSRKAWNSPGLTDICFAITVNMQTISYYQLWNYYNI